MSDFNLFVPLAKVDKKRRLISGYASTPSKDMDGEVIELAAIQRALPEYMEWGNVRQMHQPIAVGKAHDATIDDKGLMFTAKIVDDDCWKLIDEGVLQGFSIGGKVVSRKGATITDLELIEISVVDRPCNNDCRFDIMAAAKMAEGGAAVLMKRAEMPPDDAADLPALDQAEAGFIAKLLAKLTKRDFNEAQREHAAESGAALPDGSFPIENKSDLRNAIRAHGRAKDKEAAKRHIIARAHALGAAEMLPDGWEESKEKAADPADLAKSMRPAQMLADAFETIRHAQRALIYEEREEGGDPGDGSLADAIGAVAADLGRLISRKAEHEASEAIYLTDADDRYLFPANDERIARMTTANADLAKRARGHHLAKAMMHSARVTEHTGKAIECCAKAIGIHREMMRKSADASYAEAFDMISEAGAHMNRAGEHAELVEHHLSKVRASTPGEGAAGQRQQGGGERVTEGEGKDYIVPPGIFDISLGEMTEGGGFEYPSDAPASAAGNAGAGKAANITPEQAAAMIKAAVAEAKVEMLEKTIATMGQAPAGAPRARLISLSKEAMGGGAPDEAQTKIAKMIDGVDFSDDTPEGRQKAAGDVIANMINNPASFAGEVLRDPKFRGKAGVRNG